MTDYFSRALRAEDPEPELIWAQAPVQRPAPVGRPPLENPPQAQQGRSAPPAAPQAQPGGSDWRDSGGPGADYFSRALRNDPPTPQVKDGPEPFPGYRDPKSEPWGKWIYNTVKGREDPRYSGLPSLEEGLVAEQAPGRERNELKQIYGSKPFAVTAEQQADIAKSALGDRFKGMQRDAYGAHVVTYQGADGKPVRAYVNRPGFDREDVANGVLQAVPFVLTGGPMGALVRAGGMAAKMATAAGTASTTSLANDVVAQGFGSEQAPDPLRASVVGAFGAGAELVAPFVGRLVRHFWTEPKLFDKTAGTLTPKGFEAARASGVDPQTLTQQLMQEFAKEYAEKGSTVVGQSMRTREFGLDSSRGQITKDPGQLLTEKAMRTGGYGDSAKDVMQTFDRRQAMQVEVAARGGADAPLSVAQTINPNTPAAGTGPRDLGASIRGGLDEAQQVARAGEKQAWDNVGRMVATDAERQQLPTYIGKRVGSLPVDAKLTPAARAMAEDLDGFMAGTVPDAGPKVIGRQPVPDVIEMRKRLFSQMRGAQNDTDRAAARAIYEGYGEWIDAQAAAALASGHSSQAAALRVATDRTREMKAIFGERGPGGVSTPGRKMMQDVISDAAETTPELIVSKLFSVDTGAVPKAGTVEALRLMKQGLDKYVAPERATAVWNDVGLAAWKKIIEDSSGRLHTPAMMAQRIDKFFNSQRSVASELYAPDVQNLMRRFGSAMKDIAWKDPNPSGTGTANQFYASQFGRALMGLFFKSDGPVSRVFQVIMGSTPLKNSIGGVSAQSAVNPRIRAQTPNLSPYGSAIGVQNQ